MCRQLYVLTPTAKEEGVYTLKRTHTYSSNQHARILPTFSPHLHVRREQQLQNVDYRRGMVFSRARSRSTKWGSIVLITITQKLAHSSRFRARRLASPRRREVDLGVLTGLDKNESIFFSLMRILCSMAPQFLVHDVLLGMYRFKAHLSAFYPRGFNDTHLS